MRPAEQRIELEHSAQAPSEARRLVGALELDPLSEEIVRLAVSELVSNAVMHGRGPITVSLRASEEGVRVGVSDAGRGFAPPDDPRMPHPSSHGGRGLALVAMMATRWGVESGPPNEVWALIPIGD